MQWVTTSTILKGLKDFGNDEAWGRFVGRFREPIEAFGRGLGLGSSEAEDLAQATLGEFARVYRENRYEREKGRLSSYLFGIAHRQAMKLCRERARAAAGGLAEVPEDAASVAWEGHWERAVMRECLDRVRSEVDERAFAAFEMVVQRGMSAVSAAEELSVPVKFVYNAKHRVLSRLREVRAEVEGLDDGPGLP